MVHYFSPVQNGKFNAIIDIGSNTVRMVVFHGPVRIPLPVFNEKVQCRLGKGLDVTGKLNPEGVKSALITIKRFMKLIEVMDVDVTNFLATAAVREASDGPEFVKTIQDMFGVDVQVLSGEHEAKLAALGVLSGLPKADGLLGDMGGSSFDLVALNNGKFSHHETTPLGHLRIFDACDLDVEHIRSYVRKNLLPISWIHEMEDRPFFAVGGSLRAVARLLLHKTDYPLHVIDNYALPRDDLADLLDEFSDPSHPDLSNLPDVSKKRAETLPAAIILIQEIINIVKPSEIIFSGYSMREGQFFLSLPDEIKQNHPLISACKELVEREGRFGLQGEEVYRWMTPLFADEDEYKNTLRHAACLLHDIAWAEHPDYRADHAMMRVLRLPVAGLSHHDRAMMSACIYSRYKGNFKRRIAKPLKVLLAEDDELWTKTVGAALRLAHTMTGGAPYLLSQSRFEVSQDEVILHLPEEKDIFTGETLDKRVREVARHMGRNGFLKYE